LNRSIQSSEFPAEQKLRQIIGRHDHLPLRVSGRSSVNLKFENSRIICLLRPQMAGSIFSQHKGLKYERNAFDG